MRDNTRNLVVGVTAILGVAGLLYLLVMFGSFAELTEKGYRVSVLLGNASGLAHGSQVRLNGIGIGDVRKVELLDPPRDHAFVRVVCLIRQNVQIPRDAVVRVTQPLIGGSPTLVFDMTGLSPEQLTEALATDGSAEVLGQSYNIVSQFAGELQAGLDEPIRLLHNVADSFQKLSGEWRQVGANVNKLVEQRKLEDVDQGLKLGNLATVMARMDQRLVELHQVLAGIDQWVNDEALRQNVQSAVSHAASAAKKFDDTMDTVDQTVSQAKTLMVDARGQVDQLVRRYIALADDAGATLRTMQQTVELARSGEGTVGKLLNDPSLYNNLNDSAERLKVAVDELRLLLEKIQKEGLPIQF